RAVGARAAARGQRRVRRVPRHEGRRPPPRRRRRQAVRRDEVSDGGEGPQTDPGRDLQRRHLLVHDDRRGSQRDHRALRLARGTYTGAGPGVPLMPETPEELWQRTHANLGVPPVDDWDSWPFTGAIAPKELRPPVETEPPRHGAGGVD